MSIGGRNWESELGWESIKGEENEGESRGFRRGVEMISAGGGARDVRATTKNEETQDQDCN